MPKLLPGSLDLEVIRRLMAQKPDTPLSPEVKRALKAETNRKHNRARCLHNRTRRRRVKTLNAKRQKQAARRKFGRGK